MFRRSRPALLLWLMCLFILPVSCGEDDPAGSPGTDSPANGSPSDASAINVPADAPPLPREAIHDEVSAVLWLDMTDLDARTLRESFEAATAEVADEPAAQVRQQHAGPMLDALAAFQRRFTEAGGEALIVGFTPAANGDEMPQADPRDRAFIMVQVSEGADDDALGESFQALSDHHNGFDRPVTVEPLGDTWRIIRPAADSTRSLAFTTPTSQGRSESPTATARFRAMLADPPTVSTDHGEDQSHTTPDASPPIRLAMVMTDRLRDRLPAPEALEAMQGSEALALSVLQRMNAGQLSILPGNAPALAARARFPDQGIAERSVLLLEALVNSLQARLAATRWGSDGGVESGPDAEALDELLPEQSGDAVGLMIEPPAVRRLVSQVVVPALTTQRMSTDQARSATNLRNIGLAIRLHAATQGGRFPDGFAPLLRSGDLSPKMLIHPAHREDKTPPQGDPQRLARWAARQADYTITVFGQSSDVGADTVIGHEKITPNRPRIAVLFGDGEVEILPIDEARNIIEAGQRSGG